MSIFKNAFSKQDHQKPHALSFKKVHIFCWYEKPRVLEPLASSTDIFFTSFNVQSTSNNDYRSLLSKAAFERVYSSGSEHRLGLETGSISKVTYSP